MAPFGRIRFDWGHFWGHKHIIDSKCAPKLALSDTACRSAKPKTNPYKKADGGGLYLQIMPNGGRYSSCSTLFSQARSHCVVGTECNNLLLAQHRSQFVRSSRSASHLILSKSERQIGWSASVNRANTRALHLPLVPRLAWRIAERVGKIVDLGNSWTVRDHIGTSLTSRTSIHRR